MYERLYIEHDLNELLVGFKIINIQKLRYKDKYQHFACHETTRGKKYFHPPQSLQTTGHDRAQIHLFLISRI